MTRISCTGSSARLARGTRSPLTEHRPTGRTMCLYVSKLVKYESVAFGILFPHFLYLGTSKVG